MIASECEQNLVHKPMSETPRNTKINLPVKISMLYTAEFYKILHIIFLIHIKLHYLEIKLKLSIS